MRCGSFGPTPANACQIVSAAQRSSWDQTPAIDPTALSAGRYAYGSIAASSNRYEKRYEVNILYLSYS